MAGFQFLGHRLLAAGAAAHGIQQRQQYRDVGQHDRHRGLQVGPPWRQHVLVGQPDLHRQRAALQRTDGDDARHAIDRARQAAQLDHRLLAEQVAARQVVAAADRAMRVRHAGQHVAVGVAERDHAAVPATSGRRPSAAPAVPPSRHRRPAAAGRCTARCPGPGAAGRAPAAAAGRHGRG
ncbi:hypothetical protein G6F24_014754 [Rhizopus arrhizus]|nr:hypothetical protein G6F24_014754 [Rhizopus arrhizus]